MSEAEPIRLSKLMSQRGICSRREADRLIEQGLVLVDGEPVSALGTKVLQSVDIRLAESAQAQQKKLVTVMLNKPVGYVSGQAEDGYQPAVRLFTNGNQSALDRTGIKWNKTHLKGLAPAGRLDIDSQGLLILTQDGRVAKHLIGQDTRLEKEYLVRVNQVTNEQQIAKLQFGLSLDGKALKPAKAYQLNPEQLRITLIEGKKRQIRRMCEAVGLKVYGLKRVRIGNLKLGKLAEGEWRYVSLTDFKVGK